MPDDKAVVPFDPARLVDAIKDRIQAEFVKLIPDDEWRRVVEREVKAFFYDSQKAEVYYGHLGSPSGLKRLIWTELEDWCRVRVKEFLAAPEWQGKTWWANDGKQMTEPSEALKALLVKHAPEVFAATFAGMFQQVIDQMKR